MDENENVHSLMSVDIVFYDSRVYSVCLMNIWWPFEEVTPRRILKGMLHEFAHDMKK